MNRSMSKSGSGDMETGELMVEHGYGMYVVF